MNTSTQKTIIPAMSRSALSYLVFTVLSLISRLILPYWLRSNWAANDKAMFPILYLSFTLATFYLYRQTMIALLEYYGEFAYTSNDKTLFDLKYTVRILKNKNFWIILLPKLFLLAVIPSSLSFYPLIQLANLFGISKSGILPWIIIKIIIVICIIPTEAAARKRISPKPKKAPLFAGLSDIVTALLGFAGLSTGMILTFYFLYCAMKTLTSPGGIKDFVILFSPLVLLVIFVKCCSYLRALFIRHSFIKKLKKVCRTTGALLEDIYRPYLSVIRPGTKHSFTLKYEDKTYECQLLSAINKNNPVFISPDGNMEIKHYFIPKFIRAKMFAASSGFYTTSLNFVWESQSPDAKKVLILSPVSNTLFSGNVIKHSLIDVGARVGDYTVYNGTGFINAIDRNCLCIDKK